MSIPSIETPERDQLEADAIEYGDRILINEDGRITKALHLVGYEYGPEMRVHVEQCWATRILR